MHLTPRKHITVSQVNEFYELYKSHLKKLEHFNCETSDELCKNTTPHKPE